MRVVTVKFFRHVRVVLDRTSIPSPYPHSGIDETNSDLSERRTARAKLLLRTVPANFFAGLARSKP